MTTTAVATITLCLALACSKSEPKTAPEPAFAPNNSYVTLTGEITEAGPDSFTLDYGAGTILVEMDDFDAAKEGNALKAGDEVVVHGYVDDDFYERRSVEAGRVYVKHLNATFYASSLDEEDFPHPTWNAADATISITGIVTDVDARKITVATEHQKLVVDTKLMNRNPVDNVGSDPIEPGDQVQVTGWLTDGVFDSMRIQAQNVVTIDG